MDMFAQIMDKWGVNVVVIAGCLWFIKYMFDRFMSMLAEKDQKHVEEAAQSSEQLKAMTEALNGNTVVMQQILEVMRGIGGVE